MCVVRGNVVCGAHSAHVTGVAEEMRVQREALRAGLIGELLTTLLRERGGEKMQIRTGTHRGSEVTYQGPSHKIV